MGIIDMDNLNTVYFLICRSYINHITLSLNHCPHSAFTHSLESTMNDIPDTKDKKGNTIL